ncbi:MAG: pyridoxal phosphate-dependent aminotransferase [Candidatus Andersenbacteria bacterium]
MFEGKEPQDLLDTGVFFRGPWDIFPKEFMEKHLLPTARAYGHEAGAFRLREKIAEVENRKHNTAYTVANVAIVPGAWAGLVLSIEEAMGLESGQYRREHIAVIGPTLYQMFQRPIRDYGMRVIAYDYVLSGHHHVPQTMNEMEEVFSDKPRTIIISNPNNPDGVFFPANLLREVIERAAQEDIVIIIDEMQNCFTSEGACLGYEQWIEQPHVVRLDSPAKRFGLAQHRVGWVITSPELLGTRRSGIIGRMSSFIANAPKSLDVILQALLDLDGPKPDFLLEVEASLREKEYYVRERLSVIPEVVEVYPRGGCVNVAFKVDFDGDDLTLAGKLMERKTLMMPASGYGYNPTDNVLRITFTQDLEHIERGLDNLETVLRS